MKFALFAGWNFYPEGGWKDFRGTFKSEKQALNYFKKLKYEEDWNWGQIVNLESLECENLK